MDILSNIKASKKRNHLVIAGAGSGKTRTLIYTLTDKIKNGTINPLHDEVIVFTFTNKAAEELVVRLSKILSSEIDVLNRIFVGTIHGWCNHYLSTKGTLSNTKILDELERSQLIQRIYPLLKIEEAYEGTTPFEKIDKFEKDLEVFYNEGLDIDDEAVPKRIRECIKRYLHFLDSQRLMDFGYLIREAIFQISKQEKGSTIYHIYVDEYQDVNPAQVKLIQSLIGLHPQSTLFAVGDPRQAIYQWRGSDVSRILNFPNDFEDVEVFKLNENHRSRLGIVNFANIIARDMNFSTSIEIDDMTTSSKRLDSAISVISENSTINHEERIMQIIKELHAKNVKYSDIAILMRSVVNHGQELMRLLETNRIPFYSPNKNSGITFIQEFMGSIIRMMELISSESVPRNRQEEEELEKEIVSNLESIRKYCQNTTAKDIHLAIADWYEELSKHIGIDKTYKHKIYKNESYNFRRQFFDFCKKVKFIIKTNEAEIQEGFSAITQIMRAIEEVYRRRFQGLKSIRASPLEVFLHNLNWQLNHQIERWTEVGMSIDGGDRITISTVHAAKGLEWPVVIVPFLWTKKFPLKESSHGTSFPNRIAGRYGTTIEDEKRLWYVAVARARDRLYFFSGCPKGYKPSSFAYSDKIKEHINIIETRVLTDQVNLSKIEHYPMEHFFYTKVSDFLLLLECPYHFYLRRVKGVDVPVGEELGAGDVVHSVIGRVAKEKGDLTYQSIIDDEVYLPLAEYDHQERIKKSIEKKIQKLIKSKMLKNIDLIEHPFTIQIQNLVVTGVVDATRNIRNGLEIIDWKSSIREKFVNRYENQIRIYATGLRLLGHRINKGTVYNLSQEDTAIPSIDVDISQQRFDKLMRKAEYALRSLEAQRLKTVPNQTSCEICDVRFICPNPYVEKN